MSLLQGEFVFIILKPAAAKDTQLGNLIKNELLKYGDIKHLRTSVRVTKEKIREHYKYSKSSLWYPIITNYFSGKYIDFFILEYRDSPFSICIDNNQYSFAQWLKTQAIGSSDICKTKKHHLRRLALGKPTFLLDNLIHSSDNTKEALSEISIWYADEPVVIREYEAKALI